MTVRRRRILRIVRNALIGVLALIAIVFGVLCHVLSAHDREIADELVAGFNEGQRGELKYTDVVMPPIPSTKARMAGR